MLNGRVRSGLPQNILLSAQHIDCYTYHHPNECDGIVVDLGKLRNINNIKILLYGHPFCRYMYKIKLSPNRSEWTTVAKIEDTGNPFNLDPWRDHQFKTVPSGNWVNISTTKGGWS